MFERSNDFIQQGHIKLIKSDSEKSILQKTYTLNKYCSFGLPILQRIMKTMFSTKIWSSTIIFNIDNKKVFFFLEHQISILKLLNIIKILKVKDLVKLKTGVKMLKI